MTPVPTIQVLRAARKLVSNPKTWTTEALARDASGRLTDPDDPRAVCWCASGAILRAGHARGLTDLDLEPLEESLERIAHRDTDYYGIVSANNCGGRLVALSVIDAAIAELEHAQ